MKRIVSILVFITFYITSSSQSNWCQPGAYWEYSISGQLHATALLKYSGDTIIENKNCQILQNKWRLIFTGPFGQNPGPEYIKSNSYFHYSGDTLFYYFNGTFNMLFDLGASVGDSWEVINYSQFDSIYVCDSEVITVDSIGIEIFNGQPYRWIKIHSDTSDFGGKVFEHVGFIDRNFFPDHGACNSQEEPYYYLGCFSDSLFGKLSPSNFNSYIYSSIPSFNCGFYTLNVPENIDINPPLLFPNPATNKLTYEFNNLVATNYMIFSIDGREIQSGMISNAKGEIPLNLPTGVYFIQWNSAIQQTITKLIIDN